MRLYHALEVLYGGSGEWIASKFAFFEINSIRACVCIVISRGGGSPFGYPDYLCVEGNCLGYLRVSAVFAGVRGVCMFFREARPDQIDREKIGRL